MKITRRRRHLRPRPSRAQLHQQMARIRSAVQLFQLETLLEAQKPEPDLPRLRFLSHMTRLMRDEVGSLGSI